MFKIIQQKTDTGELTNQYTVSCYVYDRFSHLNREIWTARNLLETDVAELLQGRSDKQLEDAEFAFVVVNSGNGPAILTEQGSLLAASVKTPVKIKEARNENHVWKRSIKRVLSNKRRKTISH